MLTVLGLIFGLAGVVIIFIWGPPAPEITASGDEFVWSPTPDGKQRARKQKVMSRLGLGLVGVGFLLQLLGELVRRC
jgi:hypothetical protein